MTKIEVPFGSPTEHNGYSPFQEPFAPSEGLVFHGTSEDAANSIIENGFHPTGELSSSSFATSSGLALGYACQKRGGGFRGAILAVAFKSINAPGIRNEGSVVYLDDHSLQPEIIAVCYVPGIYKHL